MAFDLTAVLRLRDEVSGKLRKITGETKRVNSVFNNLTKTAGALTGALASVGLGFQAAAFVRDVVQVGVEFDRQLSKVQALSGATAEELQKLRDQAKELGRTTVFSASQAADAQAFLAMAGYNVDSILASMPGLLDLAAAGQLDLGRAADITTNIMSSFGLTAEQTGHAADVLAKASASANTNVEQLGEAIKYLGPVANSLGWELEESTAAIMAFSNSGIQGSMAGQAFASSLARLAKPTNDMLRVMDELGISFFDLQGNMKSMPDLIAELERATAGMTSEQKSAVLSILFGAEAYKHWAVLLAEGSEALAENTQMLKEADGAAKQMAETMLDNLGGSWVAFQSALEGVKLEIFEMFEPQLRKIVDGATEFVSKIPRVIKVLKEFLAPFAPLLSFLSKVAAMFAVIISGALGLKMAITVLGFLGSTVALVSAGIAALSGLFIAAYQNVTPFREALERVAGVIKGIYKAFTDQHGSGIDLLEAGLSMETVIAIQDRINQIKETFDKAKNTIIGFYKALTGQEGSDEHFQDAGFDTDQIIKIQEIIERVRESFEKFRTFVGAVVSYVTESFRIMWSVVGPIFSLFREAAGLVLDILRLLINSAIKPFVGEMTGSFAGAAEKGASLLEKIASAAEWLGQRIQQAVDAIRTLRGWLQKIEMPSWIGGITETLRPITSALTGRKRDGSHYHGLDYVPYDGYMARLHRGEAVLNRQEAEAYRNGGGGGSVNVTITGNTFNVRGDSDINEIARKLAIEIIRATEAGV